MTAVYTATPQEEFRVVEAGGGQPEPPAAAPQRNAFGMLVGAEAEAAPAPPAAAAGAAPEALGARAGKPAAQGAGAAPPAVRLD